MGEEPEDETLTKVLVFVSEVRRTAVMKPAGKDGNDFMLH